MDENHGETERPFQDFSGNAFLYEASLDLLEMLPEIMKHGLHINRHLFFFLPIQLLRGFRRGLHQLPRLSLIHHNLPMDGLLGYTGFVGSNVARILGDIYPISRSDLSSSQKLNVERLFIAAPSADKWKIKFDPMGDLKNVELLSEQLSKKVDAKRVILFSTIDVYANPSKSNEYSEVLSEVSYGGNRVKFERNIAAIFKYVDIYRLGGLYGRGLKKNFIFDLANNRLDQLSKFNPSSRYQYLSIDKIVSFCSDNSISLCNLTGPRLS